MALPRVERRKPTCQYHQYVRRVGNEQAVRIVLFFVKSRRILVTRSTFGLIMRRGYSWVPQVVLPSVCSIAARSTISRATSVKSRLGVESFGMAPVFRRYVARRNIKPCL